MRHQSTAKLGDVVPDTQREFSLPVPGSGQLQVEVTSDVVRDIIVGSDGGMDPGPGARLCSRGKIDRGEPVSVRAPGDYDLDRVAGAENPSADSIVYGRNENGNATGKSPSWTRDPAGRMYVSSFQLAGPDPTVVQGPVGFLEEDNIAGA